ncbi:MAG: U32 family peptidase [Bacteroidales bacterium]|nr:U32 family peptidase [Bacteroidales bacterium]
MSAVEIMSPVGSYEALSAAISAGAGSVYFGVGSMNMRSRSAANFTLDDLENIAGICARNNVKSYLTVNTIIYNDEIAQMQEVLEAAKKCNVTAVIASDMAVISHAQRLGLEIHLSTQCNVTNIEAVDYYSQFADVIVLGRECNLRQVADICSAIKERNITGPGGELVKIEMFVHGALCMAVSGKCYISLDNFNYPANRGACLQPCRRAYKVQDADNEIELLVDNKYIMSPKDLCTIGFLDKMVKAGVSVLKIEGRGRSPEYVKIVTQCYRDALQAIEDNTFSKEMVSEWTERLRSVYNRDFWDGYYLGRKMGEWTERYGSQATRVKQHVGKITNYFSNAGVAEIHIETGSLSTGDNILIIGPTTGVYEDTVNEVRVDDKSVETAVKGDFCSMKVAGLVRRGDKVYKWTEVADEF